MLLASNNKHNRAHVQTKRTACFKLNEIRQGEFEFELCSNKSFEIKDTIPLFPDT